MATITRPTLGRTADMGPEVRISAASITSARRARRMRVIGLQVLLGVAVLTVWEFVSGPPGQGLVDEFFISKPSAIWAALVDQVTSGVLFPNLLVTFIETTGGFVVGALLGFVVGFVLGVNELASAVIRPYVVALYSVPRLALVPLFILWFGLGLISKIAFVAMIVFFLVFYNTYSGVHDVDRKQIDVLRLMGARKLQIYAKVSLPSAMTWIIAGLSISVPYALVAAVTAEIVSSNSGIGYMLTQSAGQFDTAGVFASILVLVVVGLALTALVGLLERRLLRWKAIAP